MFGLTQEPKRLEQGLEVKYTVVEKIFGAHNTSEQLRGLQHKAEIQNWPLPSAIADTATITDILVNNLEQGLLIEVFTLWAEARQGQKDGVRSLGLRV